VPTVASAFAVLPLLYTLCILTCFDGNMLSTVKCIYDLPSYAEGRLHPKYTSGVSPLLTVCRDGQPSQSRSTHRGRLCVGFCHSLPDPGTLNNPVLLTVVLVKVWHVMSGIYLSVFTFFFSFSRIARSKTFRSSWEFFTTLDYEWRVIRGHLPHRYTIWVRNNGWQCITGVSS
jgi:hypothetical protein